MSARVLPLTSKNPRKHWNSTRKAPTQHGAAVAAVRGFFEKHSSLVFHVRGVQVALEDRFSGSTIRRVLDELFEQGELVTEVPTSEPRVEPTDVFDIATDDAEVGSGHRTVAKLIWHRSLVRVDGARRTALGLIEQICNNSFSLAVGDHAEHLVEKALGQIGGRLGTGDGRSFGEKRVETNLSLDSIFSNERGAWGFEVKNQLVSPQPAEVLAKLKICHELGLQFVLVARFVTAELRDRLIRNGAGLVIFRNWQIPRSHIELSKQLEAHAYPVRCQKDPDAKFRQLLVDAMDSANAPLDAAARRAA